MDQTLLFVLLLVAVAAIVGAALAMRSRDQAAAATPDSDTQFATSTEGMKVCPKCGMGNLWTDRACISCRAPLKG